MTSDRNRNLQSGKHTYLRLGGVECHSILSRSSHAFSCVGDEIDGVNGIRDNRSNEPVIRDRDRDRRDRDVVQDISSICKR